MRWKQVICSLVFFLFDSPRNLSYNKSKLYKTLNYWSRGMLNFNFIVCLPLLLEILGNMCITTGVIKYEISLIFLIKPFLYMTKKSSKNLNILKTERAFQVK